MKLLPETERRKFEEKLASIIKYTSIPDWDDEGDVAIPADRWNPVLDLVNMVREKLPVLPDPHPSAGNDGSMHLRWSYDGNLLDLEFPPTSSNIIWANRIGGVLAPKGHIGSVRDSGVYDSGYIVSSDEILKKLKETFSL